MMPEVTGHSRPSQVVKQTRYFVEQVLRKRPYLQSKWIEQVLAAPMAVERQLDGRVRFWSWIPELRQYLRVVTLADRETVHNAFPDRDFAGPRL